MVLSSDSPKNSGFVAGLVFTFVVLSLIGVAHHELWRDEWQGWLIAKEATSLGELLQNQRYETGRSLLWALCLFAISQVVPAAIAMQLFHVATAATTVYLIARFSPFNRLQKILFSFSYFLFFEYSQISRDYALSVLFIILFCVLFCRNNRHYFLLALCLILVSNTNFYALLIAVLLGVMTIVEGVWRLSSLSLSKMTQRSHNQRWGSLFLFLGVWLSGSAIALVLMSPPADGTITPKPLPGFSFHGVISTLAILWKAYCPMPGLTYHFWNTNLLDDGLAALLSCGLIAVAIALFIRQPILLMLWALGTGEILAVTYFKFPGTMRHWGYLFILFLVCLWLSQDSPQSIQRWQTVWTGSRLGKGLDRYKATVVYAVLWVQVAAGVFAFGMDVRFPFTAAKTTAQVIHTQFAQSLFKVGDPDWAALPVGGYLSEALYYPASSTMGTFIRFNNRRHDLSPVQMAIAVNAQLPLHPTLLLVLNYPLDAATQTAFASPPRSVGQFTDAIAIDETYYLYQFSSP